MAPRSRDGSAAFIGYPTDHVLAVFDDSTAAAEAASVVARSGVDARDVTILRGEEGARRLDGTGAQHGALARTRRLVSFTLMDSCRTWPGASAPRATAARS